MGFLWFALARVGVTTLGDRQSAPTPDLLGEIVPEAALDPALVRWAEDR